jgi:23S rRNA pseudouridine955/2504/2580 synthase
MITEYEVVEKCNDYALVKITLHTGRTHQIRAHMAKIGCPVLGDEKYGDEALNKKYGLKRQQLVAKLLKLPNIGYLARLGDRVFESEFTPNVTTNL